MSITINPPAGPWTLSDLDAVSDAGYRLEIHEGNLVVMSPATMWHSQVARRLANALEAMGRPVLTEVGIKRSDTDMRVADVAVFHKLQTDDDQAYWRPDDVALVIEVVSRSSKSYDRLAKPRWYAEAGVPSFWRVERSDDKHEAVIFQFALAATAEGLSAYIQTGVTTLANLEGGQGSNL
jgi:Uma2 family endonuclease